MKAEFVVSLLAEGLLGQDAGAGGGAHDLDPAAIGGQPGGLSGVDELGQVVLLVALSGDRADVAEHLPARCGGAGRVTRKVDLLDDRQARRPYARLRCRSGLVVPSPSAIVATVTPAPSMPSDQAPTHLSSGGPGGGARAPAQYHISRMRHRAHLAQARARSWRGKAPLARDNGLQQRYRRIGYHLRHARIEDSTAPLRARRKQ